jgi:hypothetical protein
LIEVLLLHRHMPHEQVVAGIAAALDSGALTADAVALEARRIADDEPRSVIDLRDPATHSSVVSLTERRLAQLPPDNQPMPSVRAYDELLRLRPAAQEGTPTR